jgi:hypothetical protein
VVAGEVVEVCLGELVGGAPAVVTDRRREGGGRVRGVVEVDDRVPGVEHLGALVPGREGGQADAERGDVAHRYGSRVAGGGGGPEPTGVRVTVPR